MTERQSPKAAEGHWTEEDFRAHLGKVEEALGDIPSLLSFLSKYQPRGKFSERIPFGLWAHEDHSVAVAAGQMAAIFVIPMIAMRPTHLVLSDETAASFELVDLKIAARSELGTWVSLPLDTFAVRYYASQEDPQRLFSLQDWSHNTVRVGQRIQLDVRNTASEPRHFRGILWANCEGF